MIYVIDPPGRPQSRPVMITIFTHDVRPSPLFKIAQKKNKFQARIVIATGGIVGLAEWIIDDSLLVLIQYQ